MTQPSAPVTVTRNEEAGRYEIHVGDELGGFSEVELDDEGRWVFPHTEVDPAFAGHGLGGKLVGEAMADAAAHDATVVPLCSFVATYLRGHEVAGLRIDWAAAGRDEAGNRPRADDRDAGADGGPAERGAGAAGSGSGGSGGSGV